MENAILKKAEDYIFSLFKTSYTEHLYYHNYKHTYDVVAACKEIALASNLLENDTELVLLAAWFHDAGYLTSSKNHEELSIDIAVLFLEKENYPTEKIEQINGCIRATKLDVEPKNLLQEIICDADMKGLSCKDYKERAVLIKNEFKHSKQLDISEHEWLEKEIEFLTKHRYYTNYAQLNFDESKSTNLVDRKSELAKFKK